MQAFEEAIQAMDIEPEGCLLLQNTLYPDDVESTAYRGPSTVIKTHHNVGGLPEKMKMGILEPFRLLFKDEVRSLRRELVSGPWSCNSDFGRGDSREFRDFMATMIKSVKHLLYCCQMFGLLVSWVTTARMRMLLFFVQW